MGRNPGGESFPTFPSGGYAHATVGDALPFLCVLRRSSASAVNGENANCEAQRLIMCIDQDRTIVTDLRD